MEVKTSWVDLPSEAGRMAMFVAEPASGEANPGIAYFHGVLGMNAQHQKIATQLASHGFVVTAPDLYHRLGYRLTYEFPEQRPEATKARQTLSYWGLAADSRQALNFLRENNRVATDALGIVGYCMGGRMAYLATCFNGDVKAAGLMYPSDITVAAVTPEYPVPPLALANRLPCPVLLLSGSADANPSPADVQVIAAVLDKEGVEFEYHIWDGDPPAGHGFFDEDLPVGNSAAVAWAWPLKLSFFDRFLRGNSESAKS